MDRLRQDIRIALRGFRRSPTFPVASILILALGIGMAVAMFTVVDAVRLRRLPVRDEKTLAVLWTYHDPNVELSVGRETVDRIRPESGTMREMAGMVHYGAAPLALIDGTNMMQLSRAIVTGNFFEVLGVRPELGRLLRPEDDHKGAPYVIVISFALWKSRFGGDSSIVGREFIEPWERQSVRIVGVAPPGLDYPSTVDSWASIGADGNPGMLVIARLAPGATIEGARSEFLSLAQKLNPSHGDVGAKAITFTQAVVGDVRPALIALAAAVALLLVIACVNVGSLTLVRAATRAPEFAIRRALGANASGIVRLVLLESALIACAGGALGTATAAALLRAFVVFGPVRVPNEEAVHLAGASIAIAVGVTCFALLTFAVVPAMIARAGSASPLRLGGRSGSETRQRSRMRHMLVASQIALAFVMVAGAGLVVRSLQRLEHVDLGYAPDHLSFVSLVLPVGKYDWNGPKMLALGENVMDHWRALPGVLSVTPVEVPPFVGTAAFQVPVVVEGRSTPAAATPFVSFDVGGPDFFHTLGVSLIRGRGFLPSDREKAPPVVVITEDVARRFWPGENPIGKRFHGLGPDTTNWITVVGVAGSMRYRLLRESTPTIYFAWRQLYWQGFFALRMTGTFSTSRPVLRRSVREVDPQLDLYWTRSMDDALAVPLAQPRLNAFLLSGFGIAALLLAAIGLYGVMESNVRERTREIGVRMALGATAERVRREVLRRALWTFGVGALVGVVGALAMSRLVASLLYEVSPTDPTAFLGASGLLFFVALCAAYVPALRATRIDPAQALRAE